jgi:DNA-directed RNA polymerase specialized sigma24 family protein
MPEYTDEVIDAIVEYLTSPEQLQAARSILASPIWICQPEHLPWYLDAFCTPEKLAGYAGERRRRPFHASAQGREMIRLSHLVEEEHWQAWSSAATIPVEQIRDKFFRRYPEHQGQIIIVDTHFDIARGGTMILAWAPLGKEDADKLRWQLKAIMPFTDAIVYTGEFDAMYLGIPFERWHELWARQQVGKHVIYAESEADYISGAVEKAAQDHRRLIETWEVLTQEFQQHLRDGGDPWFAAGCLELIEAASGDYVQRCADLPPDTRVSASEASTMRQAIMMRDVFGAICGTIREFRARWESAGQFGELVIRVLDRLPGLKAALTAHYSASWHDAGTTLATAGVVRTLISKPLPAWAHPDSGSRQGQKADPVEERGGIYNGHLARFLDAEAGESDHERERVLNIAIAGQVPIAVDSWLAATHTSLDSAIKELRQLVSIAIEHEEPDQGKVFEWIRTIPLDTSSGEELPTIAPLEEFFALQNALHDQKKADAERERIRALLAAAKLSLQQTAIMELRAEGRTKPQIADELGIPEDQVNPQRAKALKKLRAYFEQPEVAEQWGILHKVSG